MLTLSECLTPSKNQASIELRFVKSIALDRISQAIAILSQLASIIVALII